MWWSRDFSIHNNKQKLVLVVNLMNMKIWWSCKKELKPKKYFCNWPKSKKVFLYLGKISLQ